MAVRIDGKAVAAKVRGEIAEEIAALKKQGVQTGMAVVLVGEDPASKIYVRNKGKACAETGIYSEEHVLPENTTQEELLALIEKLNADPKINGILVQSPLPKHLNEALIVEHIDLIRSTGVTIDGKNCVVIGRSNIVGKPMAMLLLHENGTVTICHSHTKNLKEICKTADILVVAVGKAKFVTGDMVKPGAVVIDVGMNRDENGKLCGDVDYESAEAVAGYLTPVPGGVGPMTITMLMKNAVTAAKIQNGLV